MKKTLLLLFCLPFCCLAQNTLPIVEIQQAVYSNTAKNISIDFRVQDAEQSSLDIQLEVYVKNGDRFDRLPTDLATGDLGNSISTNTDLNIVWPVPFNITDLNELELFINAADGQPIDIATLVAEVDSNRLKSDMELFSGPRHRRFGEEKLQETQDSMQARFSRYTDRFTTQQFEFGTYDAANYIGRLTGAKNPDSYYIIDAHYETVAISPGADDNGSGLIGTLEACRILSKYRYNYSVDFIGFDLEEEGLLGSRDYLERLTPQDTVLGMFNLEMIGYFTTEPNTQSFPNGFELLFPDIFEQVEDDAFRGNFLINTALQPGTKIKEALESAAENYVPDLKLISFFGDQSGIVPPDLFRSDHAGFWTSRRPALLITDGSEFRNPNYHGRDDLPETLDFTFITQVVQTTIAAVATLAEPISMTRSKVDVDFSSSLAINECEGVHLSSYQKELLIGLDNCLSKPFSQVFVFDLAGQLLISENISNNQSTINLSQYPSGIYLIKVQNGDREWVEKISFQ